MPEKFHKAMQLYVKPQNLKGHISSLLCHQWNFSGKFGKCDGVAKLSEQLYLKYFPSLEEIYTAVIPTRTYWHFEFSVKWC